MAFKQEAEASMASKGSESFLSNNGNQEVANKVFKAKAILGSYYLQSIEELNCPSLANVSIHKRLSEASKKRAPKLSENVECESRPSIFGEGI